jgi:hypothetical protein
LRLAKPDDICLDQQVLAPRQIPVLSCGCNDHARSLEAQDAIDAFIYSSGVVLKKCRAAE